MSLILTRKVGEAIISIDPDGTTRRLYVVAIEGNTVRLAIDAPSETKIVREELLPPEARRRWWEDSAGRHGARIAAILATTLLVDRLLLFFV